MILNSSEDCMTKLQKEDYFPEQEKAPLNPKEGDTITIELQKKHYTLKYSEHIMIGVPKFFCGNAKCYLFAFPGKPIYLKSCDYKEIPLFKYKIIKDNNELSKIVEYNLTTLPEYEPKPSIPHNIKLTYTVIVANVIDETIYQLNYCKNKFLVKYYENSDSKDYYLKIFAKPGGKVMCKYKSTKDPFLLKQYLLTFLPNNSQV